MKLTHIALVVTLFIANASLAQRSPFFWDEFDRSDLFDSEINYIRDDTPEEEYSMEDGSLSVDSLVDDYPAVRVSVPNTPDFIIKTQGRILNPVNCQWAWLGLYGRAIESQTSDVFDSQSGLYWAGYDTQGQIHIGETSSDPENTIRAQRQAYSCGEATENDVNMELRILGSDIEFTTWLDGSPRPDAPNLKVSDDTLTVSDFVGVFINPDQLEDFTLRYLALLPAITGDFNGSGVLEVNDLDLLTREISSGGKNRAFDVDGDGIVNQFDQFALVHGDLGTWIGDANLDGEFNSADMVSVFQAGHFEDNIVGNSTWATGDWTGDAEFDSADFVVAFQDGGYEIGPRANVASVPEPQGYVIVFFLLPIMARRRAMHQRRND